MFEKKYPAENPIGLKGNWTLELHDEFGNLKHKEEGHNVVVTNGLEFLASFLKSASTAAATFVMRYIAMGTDGTAENVNNTALGTEIARVSGVCSYTSGSIFNCVATFPAGVGTGAIQEYGIFSTITTAQGIMFARKTAAVITKGASDTLTAQAQITFS